MFDYFLKFTSEEAWLVFRDEIADFPELSVDLVGVIYEQGFDGLEAIPGYHVNLRVQIHSPGLESVIGDFSIDPPNTPERVWA